MPHPIYPVSFETPFTATLSGLFCTTKERPFMVRINTSAENGLDRDSAGNVLQVRSLSTERFIRKLGNVSDETLQELLSGLVICLDYEPSP
jgi:mRNA interferase MazF